MIPSAFRNPQSAIRNGRVRNPKSKIQNRAAALLSLALAIALPAAAVASPPPTLTGLDSTRAYACGERYVYVYGTDIQTGAIVRLRQAGQADRVPLDTTVIDRGWLGGFVVCCRFNLGSGTPGGLWSVVLTNPDAQTGTLPDALEIVPECPRGRVGDLYATNVEFDNVLQFDGQTGDFVCIFAVRPAGISLNDFAPFDLAWAPNGNLWVTSEGVFGHNLDCVVEYDGQTGAFVGYIVPPALAAPCGLGMSFGGPNGNLYVADSIGLLGDEHWEFDRVTHENLGVVVSPSPPMHAPEFCRFTSSGTYLAMGQGNGSPVPTVREYDGTTFAFIRDVAVEDDTSREGVLETPDRCCYLVSDAGPSRNNVEKFDIVTGELLGVSVPENPCLFLGPQAGCAGADPCHWDAMDGPADMAYGPNGHLYVSAERTQTPTGPGWYALGVCEKATGAVHEFDPQTGEQIRVIGHLQAPIPYPRNPADPTKFYQCDGIEFKPLPGDWGSSGSAFQGDWVVDEQDFARFAAALDGTAPTWTTAANLQSFDFDHDNDLDLADFAAFQRAFGTSLQTGRGACCNSDGTCADDVWKPACSVYLGDGSTCSGGGCPAFGACCSAAFDGTCRDLTADQCVARGDLYQGDDTQCATAACPSGRYRNEVEEITTAVTAGTGLRLADDLTLAGTGARDLTYLDLSVYGNGGGAFDVTVELWTACPGSGGTLIPGTTFTWNSIPDDSYVYTLRADPINPPVTIPDTVWMVATFSTAQAGWIIADQAEIGTTANTYARNNPWTCSATITNHHAGLWANLRCVEGDTKSCGGGQPKLSIGRVATPMPLAVEESE
jgi:hypothetical protein